MAQTVSTLRNSCTVPIAIGIMVVGLFLFMTRRISEVCLIVFLVCGVAIWAVGELGRSTESAADLNLRAAEIEGNSRSLLLATTQEKTRHLRVQFWIKLVGFGIAAISLFTVLLGKVHFGH